MRSVYRRYVETRETLQTMSNKTPGIRDFLDFMSQGQPEWGILAVKTHDPRALHEIGEAVGRTKRTDKVALAEHEDLMLAIEECDPEMFDRAVAMVPVLRITGSDWLVVFHSIGSYPPELDGFAQSLSAKLHTKCIAFSGEDTSSAMGYSIYQDGDKKETCQTGDVLVFESKERPTPDLQNDDDDHTAFLEEVFKNN